MMHALEAGEDTRNGAIRFESFAGVFHSEMRAPLLPSVMVRADMICVWRARSSVFMAPPYAQDTPAMDLSDFQFLRAIDFIEDNLTRDIPLAEMARAVDVPPQRLADGFAAETGCSIDSFRAERRVGIVQQLLRSAGRDMTTGQIAPKVGFADTAALDAVFRAHLGVSVNNYRAGRLG